MEVIGLILVIGYIIHMCVSLSNSRGFSFHDDDVKSNKKRLIPSKRKCSPPSPRPTIK